jgi:hypothetical protein
MTSESPGATPCAKLEWVKCRFIVLVALALVCVVYVRTQPLAFKESMFRHAHCIPQPILALRPYAVSRIVGGNTRSVPESRWPDQIEPLVKAGFDRAAAETLYAEKGKAP